MNHIHYIIIKNPEAAKTKYFGATDWTYNRDEAVRFEGMSDAMRTIKAIACATASAATA